MKKHKHIWIEDRNYGWGYYCKVCNAWTSDKIIIHEEN